ncbi:MAG: LysM peptidoglycan-binding domain-containing protein [Ardenticatenales bacterium]
MRSRLSIAVLSLALALAFTAASHESASANNWGPGWQGGNVHCVKNGETLYGIAWAYGTTAQAIAHANGLWNPNYIRAGACLTIPSGGDGGHDAGWDKKPGMNDGHNAGWDKKPDYNYGGMAGNVYCVQHGDTLYSIANRYGTTAWAIAQANGLWNPNYIRAGQTLKIPGRGW